MDASKGIINFNEDDLRIQTSKIKNLDIYKNNADVKISTQKNKFS
jgi:hypothetical protein